MAVWADLDDPDDEPSGLVPHSQLIARPVQKDEAKQSSVLSSALASPEQGSVVYIAHALRCYPISAKLASYLDLTDLDSLSSACKPFHDSLIQFARQLKQNSLRCAFEIDTQDHEEKDAALALQLSLEDQLQLSGEGPASPVSIYHEPQPAFQSALGLSGKVSKCARDLVAPCRKCGTNVCRNCIEKPPSNKHLPGRLRRLCDSCLEVPLILHEAPLREPTEPSSSASSTRSNRSDSSTSETSDIDLHQTAQSLLTMPDMFLRDPCTCADRGVYLCQQCGHNNYAADNIYQRVWKWRSRYSTHLGGGLGTGLGLGNQGQKCGRDKHCLATRDTMTVMEAECSSDDVSTPASYETRSHTPVDYDRQDPGYFRQEIEGVGGKVKSKSRKLVKVGATVYEFRDERESGKHLKREAEGELRSWCSWCSRVSPSKQEQAEMAMGRQDP